MPARPPIAVDKPAQTLRDYQWVVAVWIVVGVFAIVTAARSREVGVPFRDPHGAYFSSRLVFSIVLFVALSVVDASIRTRRHGWRVGKVMRTLRLRWPRERLVLALSGLIAYYLVYVCYHNLKSWVAFHTPRDHFLQSLDRMMFLGHDPAVLLHDLFGQHLAAHIFPVIYESFSTLVPVSVVAALVFADRIRDGYVFLMASLWVWIFGVGCYYLIPSIGPFASAPQDFAALPHTMISSIQGHYLAQREHLLHHPAAPDSFAQLSAFASLHVGFTCMALLVLRYFRFRRATKVMTVYLVAIILSTIYLGWHFAVDDIAGLALAFSAVFVGREMIYPRGRLPSMSRSG